MKKILNKSFIFILPVLIFLNPAHDTNNFNKNIRKNVCSEIVQEGFFQKKSEKQYSLVCDNPEQENTSNIFEFEFTSNFILGTISLNDMPFHYQIIDEYHFEINIVVPNGDSSALLTASSSDGTIEEYYSLYFSENENIYFSTNLSLDTAIQHSGKELCYQFVESVEPDNEQPPRKSGSIGTTGHISGYLSWNDEEGNSHPLVGARVLLKINGSLYIKSVFTDAGGYYSINYSKVWYIGTGKPTIHIFAANLNLAVCNDYAYMYNYKHSFSQTGGSQEFSYCFSPIENGDFGKAINIFQAVYYYDNFAKTLNGGEKLPPLNVFYPSSRGTCCGTLPDLEELGSIIFLEPEKSKIENYPSAYAAWDVIGHEYGHHIQQTFDIITSFLFHNDHYIFSNIIDDQYNLKKDDGSRIYSLASAKNRGLKMAWSEGVPTFLAMFAQTTFPEHIKNIFTVNDSTYSDYSGFSYDVDSYVPFEDGKISTSHVSYLGDADEIAINSVLYKMWSAQKDEYDKFSIDFYDLWNVIKSSKAKTFYEFIHKMYEVGYNANDIGKLLSQYKIVPCDLQMSNCYLDSSPTFTWNTKMGSKYLKYDNFDLVFLDKNKEQITKISNIVSNEDEAVYTLSETQWKKVLSGDGNIFYVYIISKQTYSFVSGNYVSELFPFSEPTDFLNSTNIKPSEWGFEQRYYFENEGIKTSTLNKGNFTISTSRLRCGFIQNSYIVLSPRRVGAGRSYFEITFNEPVYKVIYDLAMWSNKENLDGNAFIQFKDENGNWSGAINIPINELPKKEQGINRYLFLRAPSLHITPSLNMEITCYPIYGIRFETTSTAAGSNNKGRLCIGGIALDESYPTYQEVVDYVLIGNRYS